MSPAVMIFIKYIELYKILFTIIYKTEHEQNHFDIK